MKNITPWISWKLLCRPKPLCGSTFCNRCRAGVCFPSLVSLHSAMRASTRHSSAAILCTTAINQTYQSLFSFWRCINRKSQHLMAASSSSSRPWIHIAWPIEMYCQCTHVSARPTRALFISTGELWLLDKRCKKLLVIDVLNFSSNGYDLVWKTVTNLSRIPRQYAEVRRAFTRRRFVPPFLPCATDRLREHRRLDLTVEDPLDTFGTSLPLIIRVWHITYQMDEAFRIWKYITVVEPFGTGPSIKSCPYALLSIAFSYKVSRLHFPYPQKDTETLHIFLFPVRRNFKSIFVLFDLCHSHRRCRHEAPSPFSL